MTETHLRGLRKWSISMVALVLAFVLSLLGKLTAEFATIATIAVGAFAASNAYTNRNREDDNGDVR